MVLIQRHDGAIYDLVDYGIRTRDLQISSPVPRHETEQVEGSNVAIDYGTTYEPRPIYAYFKAVANDIVDFSLLRDEIFHLFRTEKSFYLIEKRVRGKRWRVKVANPYVIPQRAVIGNFEIEFTALDGVAESIGRTSDIDQNGITYDSELWSYGMGLLYDEESHKYTHSRRSFRIYNAGNILQHHPFERKLKITIQGASKGYELRNITTGDVFKFNEQPNGSIVIDGPVITDAGLIAFRKTNRHFITLAPGWNEFEQNQSATVSFDFPFYYL